ncbi:MAG TPA: lysylphosphatidylglycerol synthase transmembrane domain-containing protein [Eubacteriales bacterium]|nr:lysylphosphatidylglycerol synthase transmembrane domain-containing protein [Eubacteriales bacterium]
MSEKPEKQSEGKNEEKTVENVEKKSKDILIVIEERKKRAENLVADETATVETPKILTQSKKRTVLSMVFLLVICAVSIIIMIVLGSSLSEGSAKSLQEIFSEMETKYFLFALVVLFLMLILDASKFFLIGKVAVGKARALPSLKVSLLGKYYDNITPFSTGGQAFQIYYLNKKGYSAGQASAITMIKYFAQMFAWLLVSVLLMSLCNNALDGLNANLATTLRVGAWTGFAFNAFLPLTLILFVILPKFANIITAKLVSFLHKIKIIKDKEKIMGKAQKTVKDFKKCFFIMSNRPLYFILLIFICFFEPIVTLSFPYFLVLAFAKLAPSWDLLINVMALNIFASYAVAIIPTPGNSGFVETTFTLAFSSIAASVLFGVTFTWRFLTYYIYIIIGLCITVFEIIRKFVRAKRQEKALGEKK